MLFTYGCAAGEEAVFEVAQASLVPAEEAAGVVHTFRVLAVAFPLVFCRNRLFLQLQVRRQLPDFSNLLFSGRDAGRSEESGVSGSNSCGVFRQDRGVFKHISGFAQIHTAAVLHVSTLLMVTQAVFPTGHLSLAAAAEFIHTAAPTRTAIQFGLLGSPPCFFCLLWTPLVLLFL